MVSLGYVSHELRRRSGRTIVTALGLSAGVGLVMGIVGVSQGLREAQASVLAPLTSVGTDILVTRTVGATSTGTGSSATPTPTPSADTNGRGFGGGGGFFAGGPPDGGGGGGRGAAVNALASLNDADQQALLNENLSIVTDLSKLGKPGTKFTRDFFIPGTLISFPSQAISAVAKVPHVQSAVGALTLTAQHETGTVPTIVASIKTGGETLTATARPAPLTAAEQEATRACFAKSGAFDQIPVPGPSSGPGGGGGGGGGGFRGDGGRFGAAFTKCLPARFQEYNAKVIAPLRTINQIVNPPSTDTTNTSYTVAGIDPAHPETGLITKAQLKQGAWLSTGTAGDKQVLVSSAYATRKSLTVGSTLTINGTAYSVVGLVDPTLTGNTADVYFSLSQLQSAASKAGRVNEVLVRADKASDVDAVAAAIRTMLPGAQVVTTKSLADQVTGSLADARKLADRLGGALAVIVLVAAFVIASLLTTSSVSKRVREIGTLRAIGWSRRRVVSQILTETTGIGLLGGVLGLVVGFLVCAAVGVFGPTLSATSGGVGVGSSSLSSLFNQAASTTTTQSIHVHAPVHPATIALGLAVALVGGLLAGAVGGWRASRLSPAAALRDLG